MNYGEGNDTSFWGSIAETVVALRAMQKHNFYVFRPLHPNCFVDLIFLNRLDTSKKPITVEVTCIGCDSIAWIEHKRYKKTNRRKQGLVSIPKFAPHVGVKIGSSKAKWLIVYFENTDVFLKINLMALKIKTTSEARKEVELW